MLIIGLWVLHGGSRESQCRVGPLAGGRDWGSLGGIVRVCIGSFILNKSYESKESIAMTGER